MLFFLQKGMYAMIGVCSCLAVWVTVMVFAERRMKRKVVIDAVVADDEGGREGQVQEVNYVQGDKGVSKV